MDLTRGTVCISEIFKNSCRNFDMKFQSGMTPLAKQAVSLVRQESTQKSRRKLSTPLEWPR